MSDDFVLRLAQRRPGTEALEGGWRLVDDVLAGRIKRRGAEGWASSYFPKGRLEPAAEYSLRMTLTPFFPQTPQLLASRLGALFKQPLQVELHEADPGRTAEGESGKARHLQRLLREAGRWRGSFEDLAVQAATLAQTHGYCAALIDREALPGAAEDEGELDAETQRPQRPQSGAGNGETGGRGEEPEKTETLERTDGANEIVRAVSPSPARRVPPSVVSLQEARERQLGRPYIALYSAAEILDWEYGGDGRLSWVKFCEEELWRPTWDAPHQLVQVYRIVDREFIHVYRVRRASAGGETKVFADGPIAHGFGRVPVVFLHPFPAADGIGRSILQRSAEADIAAARVLSDLVWDLFLLGNPILTFATNRSDEELTRLGLGATRYIPLRSGRPGVENPEELKFVQLDSTGIELLFRAHGLFAAQARAASGGEEVAAVPREVSGVAHAWRFKTGEERVLFLLARALEPFLARCAELLVEADAEQQLSQTARSDQRRTDDGTEKVTEVTVRLAESFDVSSPHETLDAAGKLLELAARHGQSELGRAALERIEGALGVLPSHTREALRRERAAWGEKSA